MKKLSENARRFPKSQALLCSVAAAMALSMIGCTTSSSMGSGPAQMEGAQIDDHNTTLAVGRALAGDPEYKFDSVIVETSAGTVQLSGFLMSNDQKTQAGNIARNVNTVKSVLNNITVRPSMN